MTELPRRTLLAAGAALPLVAIRTRPAGAAEFSYKYANNLPPTHPLNLRATEAAGADSRGDRRAGGDHCVPEQPARLGHRHAEPAAQRARSSSSTCPA